MRKLITPLAISAALLFASQSSFAQNVGINTQQPDPSAALDIVGTDKGLLIPRVSLQSLIDNTTVPNPANALLVYNTNAGLGKAGFYYNSGTSANPLWSLVGGSANLALPFSQTSTTSGPLFLINNTDANDNSVAISGLAGSAIGLRGATLSGKGIVGHSASSGTGIFASAANANGKALEVSGPMTIAGPGQSPGNGKVLTSDANGNATWENISGNVAFRASGVLGGGSEIIAGNTVPMKVAFAAQNYDLGNNYDDVNAAPHSTFNIPFSGLYHFDAQVHFIVPIEDGDDYQNFFHSVALVLTRNNFSSVIVESKATDVIQAPSAVSTDIQLIQGDKIHIEATMNATKSGTLGVAPQDSFFSGRLLFKQ